MGTCIYCGEPAGLLRKTHKECKDRFQLGSASIISLVSSFAFGDDAIEQLDKRVEHIAQKSLVSRSNLNEAIISGWEKAVDTAFGDGLLSMHEEKSLMRVSDHFGLSKSALDKNGYFTKVVKGATLRDVFEGKVPDRFEFDGGLHFNLQKTEKIVWVFQHVDYFEEKC